jgi:predicted CoA-binding protein
MASSFARDEDILEILNTLKTVAVVGCSPDPFRESHLVARFLKERGYRVIPVNPASATIFAEPCYPALMEVPEPVEVVDVFRRSEHVAALVEEVIEIKAQALWLQEGVIDIEAAQRARQAGLKVVMDRCMLKQWYRFQKELA